MIQERAQLLAHEVPSLLGIQRLNGEAFHRECLRVDHGMVNATASRAGIVPGSQPIPG